VRVWWPSFGGDEIMLSGGISSRSGGLIHPHIAVIVRGDGLPGMVGERYHSPLTW
jgi:hypothetical protein